MKIGLVNFTPMTYDVETPYNEPLGGSESALCYLAEALAKRGSEVYLFRRIEGNFTKLGVKHLSINELSRTDLDVLILQNTPDFGNAVRKQLKPKTKLILWSQHASNQPAVAGLQGQSLQDVFDKIVLISQWQKQQYMADFKIDPGKITVIGNAISPAFENLEIGKKIPWSMAYTSTPFRGLNLLSEIFPRIRHVHPEATLSIFSSMKVYQAEQDEYSDIYESLSKIEGVEYGGSLSQSELAKRLSRVAILTYPNTFPETSCIAVMEAMALGLQVVTSDLGALPETTTGFARLVSIIGKTKEEYVTQFVEELLKPIGQKLMAKQVDYVQKNYVWSKRAEEWEELVK